MTSIPVEQQMTDALRTHYSQAASGLDLLEQSEERDRALDALMESFRWLSRALAVEETPETG